MNSFKKWWIWLGLSRYEQSVFVSVYVMAVPRDIRSKQSLIALGLNKQGRVCPKEVISKIREY